MYISSFTSFPSIPFSLTYDTYEVKITLPVCPPGEGNHQETAKKMGVVRGLHELEYYDVFYQYLHTCILTNMQN